MKTNARLPRTAALTVVAGLAAAVLAACGTDNGSSGAQAAHPSSSMMASAMGGSMPSRSLMGMDTASAGPSGAMGTPASGPHNAADVTFATGMIPHHAQAVAMAALAATRAKEPQVRVLAAQIRAAQDPEITEMSGWVKGWGVTVPSGDTMSGTSMEGMMSSADMADLARAGGTAFDRRWLTMMTTHHQGAVSMAEAELRTGVNADVRALASSIISGQTEQISRMRALLAELRQQ